MNFQPILLDIEGMLTSKRATYTIIIIAVFALTFALVVEFSPESLINAIETAKPEGSAGVFEFIWFEDVLKFLLLMVVSFGAFIICDLEDDETLDLTLARPESRLSFLVRRTLSSVISFLIIFFIGTLVAGGIAWAIVGGLDLPLFLVHHLMIMPMLLFVFSLTFFFSVPLRTTTYTVLAGFAVSLILSFTYSFELMANPGSEPSIFNPLAFGYRVMAGLPLANGFYVLLAFTIALFIAGGFWFIRKDL
jgi:ABC-type transport system involved in multi-copper enzyme maturation permease subunit